MIASAGITSVVIGIGAQNTVGDIIAGFFIVLEGHVRIGDWVRVNDFRGINLLNENGIGIPFTTVTIANMS